MCFHLGKMTTAASLTLILMTGAVQADVQCGDIITRSVKLSADLTCDGQGLIIGADDVTLDLNGHTITGIGPEGDEYLGVSGEGLEHVTIKNGEIRG
ncbi:MAG TPA: hypothetical protein VEK15_05715, partial [Vicinamibacteria bacterium]|nr:hypothetical protein [Vicinamibacteria bacterium]